MGCERLTQLSKGTLTEPRVSGRPYLPGYALQRDRQVRQSGRGVPARGALRAQQRGRAARLGGRLYKLERLCCRRIHLQESDRAPAQTIGACIAGWECSISARTAIRTRLEMSCKVDSVCTRQLSGLLSIWEESIFSQGRYEDAISQASSARLTSADFRRLQQSGYRLFCCVASPRRGETLRAGVQGSMTAIG